MKKRLSLLLAATLSASLLLSACGGGTDTPAGDSTGTGGNDAAPAGETVQITFGSYGSSSMPPAMGWEDAIAYIEETSGGTIQIDFVPDGVLGGESDMMQQTMDGTIQCTESSASSLNLYTNLSEAFQLPFLITSYDLEWQAIQTPEFQALLDATGEEMGLYICGVFDSGMRHIGMIDKPINTMADLSGVKLRTASSELLLDALTTLGASPIVVNYNEVYSALQNGVVDGEDVNYLTAVAQKHYEILGYMSEIGMYPYPSYVCFNRDAVDSLPEGYWDFMQECMNECMEDYFTNIIVEADAEAAALMEENGVVINQISDADAWADAMQPIYDEYLASADERVVAFVEAVQALKAAE